MTYREFLEKIDRSYGIGDVVYIPETYDCHKDELERFYNNACADGYVEIFWNKIFVGKLMMRILEKPNIIEDLATIYFG